MSTPADAATEPAGADWGEAPVALGATMGRYQLRAVVGAGGMGVVFEALDPELARTVAVKVLRTSAADDTDGAARMRREGQTMAQLTHPNVIRVYDVGVAHGHAFVAMEFVAGLTLAGWLEAKPRTPAEILAVFVQAGRGLAAAHARELVHRDFKPGNVLVGDEGRVLVTDFGLARATHDAVAPAGRAGAGAAPALATVTVTGQFVGTPAYMAPEQYATAPVDARADQFSFCVALWRALFGTPPYAGTTLEELVAAAEANHLVPPPASAMGRATPAVRAALERGLRGDPAERFAAMTELLAALEPRRAPRVGRVILAGAAMIGGGVAIWLIAASQRTAAPTAVAPREAAGTPMPPPDAASVAAVTMDAPPAAPAAPPAPPVDAAPIRAATDARRAPRRAAPPPDDTEPPDSMGEYEQVAPVLDPIRRRARTCGAWTTADGYAATFEVDSDGAVSQLDVTGPDSSIATCMSGLLQRARFPRSKLGGTVSMRFVRD